MIQFLLTHTYRIAGSEIFISIKFQTSEQMETNRIDYVINQNILLFQLSGDQRLYMV